MSGLPGEKGGTTPPAILQDRHLSKQKLQGTPEKQNAHLPPSTHSHKAAHLDSGLGVPDLHELVVRPAGDAIAVRGESDGLHPSRVPRQRVHLPPTQPHLRRIPRQNLLGKTAENTPITSPHSTQSHKNAHLASSLGVPDLHELVRSDDEVVPIRRESDASAGARMAERVHLPMKPASALQTPPTSAQPVRFPGRLDCPVSVHTCHSHPPHTPSKTKPAENAGNKKTNIFLGPAAGLGV